MVVVETHPNHRFVLPVLELSTMELSSCNVSTCMTIPSYLVLLWGTPHGAGFGRRKEGQLRPHAQLDKPCLPLPSTCHRDALPLHSFLKFSSSPICKSLP